MVRETVRWRWEGEIEVGDLGTEEMKLGGISFA